MSLKILSMTIKIGEASKVYNLAGCDLLQRLADTEASAGKEEVAGSGSETSPYGGMDTAGKWRKLRQIVAAQPEQYFAIAKYLVVKGAGGYYMNTKGLITRGAQERGGPSYHEFQGLVEDVAKSKGITSPQITQVMRKALTDPKAAAPATWIPALVAAMFMAEPKRNDRAFPINLMLMDFVEQGITYGKSDREFNWANILWREGFGADENQATKDYSFGGQAATLDPHERGGKLPMSHTGASDQSKLSLPAHPPDGSDFHFANSEQQKEGTILVRWLLHYLRKNRSSYKKVAGLDPFEAAITYEVGKEGGGTGFQWVAKGPVGLSLDSFRVALKAVDESISGALTKRCTGLGCIPLK